MQPGDIVAERFEIERRAGSGGMGVVYRARGRVTGSSVALKLVHGQSQEPTERFTREGRLLAGLRHPGIVRYVAHGATTDGHLYLAMEWLEGEDLARRLGRSGLTIAESVRVVSHAAQALSEAHEQGIVHRDLKPSNLFLENGELDRVRILDFGVARLGEDAHRVTITGEMVGTPSYMAPEQARGGKVVDARADVFALGCVLFACLTGRRAFAGDNLVAVLAKILFEPTPRVSERRPDVPPALDDLVARMMAKERADRPADARAVLAELAVLGTLDDTRHAVVSERPDALTQSERRFLCVVAAGPPPDLETIDQRRLDEVTVA